MNFFWLSYLQSQVTIADTIIYYMSGLLVCTACIVFFIGVFGILTTRKNIIIILLSIELLLLAVNINFGCFSVLRGDPIPQTWIIYVLTLAGAEAAIGLAILILFYRIRGVISVNFAVSLKG